MAQFPNAEADIVALASAMIAGYTDGIISPYAGGLKRQTQSRRAGMQENPRKSYQLYWMRPVF